MLNRLLLVQSYFPDLRIEGDNDCDDVREMRQAVRDLGTGLDLQVGAAGTVLRFMALRASRLPGRHRLVGDPRLFARPQSELIKVLRQLDVRAELGPSSLEIESSGWRMHGDMLHVASDQSSQFASAVLLNSWDLPVDLFVSLGGRRVSEGYWRMSVRLAEQLGMRIDFGDHEFRVPRRQKTVIDSAVAEIDLSSAFALAGVAAVSGQATFLEFPDPSLQPDAAFVSILERMGVPVEIVGGSLHVKQAAHLRGVRASLTSTPDLFPVLAVLCAFAEGESELIGAPHLVHKESDRLGQLAEWTRQLGREVTVLPDGLRIAGERPGLAKLRQTRLRWDCKGDHRLGFAAAVARAQGASLEILHPEAVSKSFPEFWDIVGAPVSES